MGKGLSLKEPRLWLTSTRGLKDKENKLDRCNMGERLGRQWKTVQTKIFFNFGTIDSLG